jgi:hypothetical protein
MGKGSFERADLLGDERFEKLEIYLRQRAPEIFNPHGDARQIYNLILQGCQLTVELGLASRVCKIEHVGFRVEDAVFLAELKPMLVVEADFFVAGRYELAVGPSNRGWLGTLEKSLQG